MKLYVCGPMTGIEKFNYPAFNQVKDELRAAGYEVLCPTEVDPDCGCEPPEAGKEKSWDWYMRRTLTQVLQAEGIALLPKWPTSRGAMLELQIASALKLEVRPWADWIRFFAD